MFASKLTPRLLTAFTIGAGAWMACMVIVGWGATVYTTFIDASDTQKISRVGITDDGTPIVSTYEHIGGVGNWKTELPDGNPHAISDEDMQSATGNLANLPGPPRIPPGPTIASEHRCGGVVRSTTVPAIYYYIVQADTGSGRFYFEGFSSATRQRTGYIGASGWTESIPSLNEQFDTSQARTPYGVWSIQQPVNYSGVQIPVPYLVDVVSPLYAKVFVPIADNVLVVDLNTSDVQKLLPVGEPVLGVAIDQRSQRGVKTPRVLVRTEHSVLSFSEKLELKHRWEIPVELLSCNAMLMTATDGSTWIHLAPQDLAARRLEKAESESRTTLLHYANDGSLLTTHPIVLKSRTHVTDGWETPAFTSFSPPVGVSIFLLVFLPLAMSWDSGTSWAETLPQVLLPGVICGLVICLLMGLLFAILTLRHTRRQQLSSTACWTWFIFVLLFGPTAYLGYRYHRRWPRPLPCPTGGHTLPADRFECPTCQASWPLPAAKGIEVLQPAGE